MPKKQIVAFLFLVLFFAGWLMPLTPIFAVDQAEITNQLKSAAGEKGAGYGTPRDPRAVAGRAIQILLGLTSIIFIAYLVYAGYLIMGSGGEEEKINKGKKIIVYAVLGIVISLSAFSISLFFQRYLVGEQDNLIEWNKSSGAWFTEGNIHIDEDASQFEQPDALQQPMNIWSL